jgi:ABC-type nickel/cobalt efflux system permease component RcnA
VTSSGLGSLLGMRHALEPDHLAAVSTLVTEERNSWRAALLGACWGLGHTVTLVLVGVVLIVLRAEMPARVDELFELGVALMLIALGLRAIYLALREGAEGPVRPHQHGARVHTHHTGAPHIHIGTWTLARRPLIIGSIHGLAGSGALTALVFATLPTTTARIAYVGLFGLGSTLGMAALSGVLGLPLARLRRRHTLARGVSFLIGCTSTVLGVAWGYPLLSRLIDRF